jgi:hypothetical protein
LFQIVQRFVLFADLIDFLLEVRELHDKNILVNLVVQKDDLDVHLLDFSIVDDDYDVHRFVIY